MITEKEARKLSRLIDKTLLSLEAHSWRGAGDPEHMAAIIKRHETNGKKLYDYIESLKEPK